MKSHHFKRIRLIPTIIVLFNWMKNQFPYMIKIVFIDLEDDNVDEDDPLLELAEYEFDSNEEDEELYDEMNKTDSG